MPDVDLAASSSMPTATSAVDSQQAPQSQGLGTGLGASAPDDSSSPSPLAVPQTSTPQQASQTNAQPTQKPGLLKRVGNALVQAGGHPAPTYSEDADTGKLVQDASNASPGQLFKNLASSMLIGLGAAAKDKVRGPGGFGSALAGAGVGFTAASDADKQADTDARNKAIQAAQQQQKATATSDEHQAATQEDAVRAATITHMNAATIQATAETSRLNQTLRNDAYDNNQRFIKTMTDSGGTILHAGLTSDQLQAKLADDKTLGYTSTFRAVGEQPYLDPQGKPILGKDGKPQAQELFDVVGVPQTHTLTAQDIATFAKNGDMRADVTPGQVIDGAAYINLHRKDQAVKMTDLKQQQAQANLNEKKAQTNEANEHVAVLANSLDDKRLGDQAQKDWGASLTAAGGDTSKATAIFQQKYPVSYGLLASKEGADAETITTKDATGNESTKTSMKRMFTHEAPPPPAAITNQQKQGIATVAANMVKQGANRALVQTSLQQKLGTNTPAMMQYLDGLGVFKVPVASKPFSRGMVAGDQPAQ